MAFFSNNIVYIADSTSRIEVQRNCPLVLYAVKKDYLLKKGIKKIKWKKDKNVRKSENNIDAISVVNNYVYTSNLSRDIKAVEINLFILGFNEKSMIMCIPSMIYKFYSDRPDEIVYFKLDSLQETLKLSKDF